MLFISDNINVKNLWNSDLASRNAIQSFIFLSVYHIYYIGWDMDRKPGAIQDQILLWLYKGKYLVKGSFEPLLV